jgi:hypothetical protein
MNDGDRMAVPEISTLIYRIESLERKTMDLSAQLEHYVPIRENELKLQNIQESMRRIEGDVREMKGQLVELNTKLLNQNSDQRESQNKLLIRVLWGAMSLVIGTMLTILIAYITHFF